MPTPAVFRHLLVHCALIAGFATGSAQASSANAWLFTSFRGEGDGLHLAYSHDGLDWTNLDRVFLRPAVGAGLMRDPHLLRDADGLYHLVWTTGWKDLGIGYATSRDLETWSEQRFLPITEGLAGAENCWAPELYRVPETGDYAIVWSSSVRAPGAERGAFRAYYTRTADFKNFTPPALLLDPGVNNIDTTIVRTGDRYTLFFKEADDQNAGVWGAIRTAVSANLLGPYEVLSEPALSGERAEGPAPVVVGDQTLLYFDYYANNRYGVRASTDQRTWTDMSNIASVVPGQRHGSILPVESALVEALRQTSARLAGAPAPALEGWTADPAIRAFGDRYYIYPTSDRPYWNTTEFAVWSSPDLIAWKKETVFLDLARGDVAWGKNKAWAPDCIERDGKYYFYFCAEHNIGVAVGDSPIGPFRDALGRPLVEDAKIKTFSIDPHAFIDDDGQAYLYFGNGTPTVWRLNRDMISFSGEPVEFKLREFREGIVTFKRGGKYYYMWSIDDARSPDYRVGWGISDSPLGDVVSPEKNFIVLRQNGAAKGTAHHSVVNVPGTDRWYVAYHRHAIPGGGGYKRETVLVRMEFDADGNILPMDPMQPAFRPGDVGEPLVNGRGRP